MNNARAPHARANDLVRAGVFAAALAVAACFGAAASFAGTAEAQPVQTNAQASD